MDFLKTLLLYMTVTMATAVQEGPLPENVPVPTAAPTAQVEQQASPGESPLPGLQVELASAEAPEPTAEPSPTITPNRSYKNIEFGDRGNDVKKMQKRLIELGYLPEGSDDGAFGYQTNRALKEFQGKNGLNKDGVAGPATLTRLYEDPDVVAITTPTPEPTDTPSPDVKETVTIAPPESTETAETAEAATDALVLAEVPSAELVAAPVEAAQQPVAAVQQPAADMTEIEGGAIVLGSSGSRLAALRLVDGVMQPFYPRVWQNVQGDVLVSLRDMAESINAWTLQIEEDVFTLEAAGYTVVLTASEQGIACAVDGEELTLHDGEALMKEQDIYVTADFLREALGADVVWDADEKTLMLNIPDKEAAQAND